MSRGSLPVAMNGAEASAGWNLAVRHQPAFVAKPRTVAHLSAALRFAGDRQLPVTVCCTGHGATVGCQGGLLVHTAGLQGVRIDSAAALATVRAGASMEQLLRAAHLHALAPLVGSTSHVGVVGYTLGGGVGWLLRSRGLAADAVTAVTLATPTGLRKLSADDEPALFAAVVGGAGGNLGVVTELTLRLDVLKTCYGGGVWYPMRDAAAVLSNYRDWTAQAPARAGSSLCLTRLPPALAIGGHHRLVSIRGCYTGDPDDGPNCFGPVRRRPRPLRDTFAAMPFADFDSIAADPTRPIALGYRGLLLRHLPDSAIDALLSLAGADADAPYISLELRHLGGAPSGPVAAGLALHRAAFLLLISSHVGAEAEMRRHQDFAAHLGDALRPYLHPGTALNFLGPGDSGPDNVRAAFTDARYAALVRAKQHLDPDNLFGRAANISPNRLTGGEPAVSRR